MIDNNRYGCVWEDIPAVAIARPHREHLGSGSVAWSRWCVQIHVHLPEPYKNTGEYLLSKAVGRTSKYAKCATLYT